MHKKIFVNIPRDFAFWKGETVNILNIFYLNPSKPNSSIHNRRFARRNLNDKNNDSNKWRRQEKVVVLGVMGTEKSRNVETFFKG